MGKEDVPSDVTIRGEARQPVTDSALGIAAEPSRDGTPRHRLVAVGDSLTHGFQSGAIFNTQLSYPALIARELGYYDQFQHPSYEGFGGLPLNFEYLLRELEREVGESVSLAEAPGAILRIRNLMDQIEDRWERDAEPPDRFGTINNNLAVYGYDLFDARERTAEQCRRDISRPTDALFKQFVSNANERAALRVLAPGPDLAQERRSQLASAAALGALGSRETPGQGDGIETLIVLLGANNALGVVTKLSVCWSTDEGYQDPRAKAKFTVWRPTHFQEELDRVAAEVKKVRARHVIWGTVPHVTIAPIAHGVDTRKAGPEEPSRKVDKGSRYFPYYTRPWISDAQFDPARDPHITADDARAVDSAIDQYNDAITATVAAGRREGRDWRLLDIAGLLDRLAARRYIQDEASRPAWWEPYPLPEALGRLSPPPDSQFFAVDSKGLRTAGGLFSLDGVHPTTIAYGLVAQEFVHVMEETGVIFREPDGITARDGPIELDFAQLLAQDSLMARPPSSLSNVLDLVAWVDDKARFFQRMLGKGP